MKEGQRLIFPGFCCRPLRSRESARNREIERLREKKKGKGTQALVEQGCFTEFCKSIHIYICIHIFAIPYFAIPTVDRANNLISLLLITLSAK